MTTRQIGEPLTYNDAGLLADPAGSTRDYVVAGVMLDLGEDLYQSDPVEGTIHLARTNRGLLVRGDLRTSLDEECSRCLREVEVPLELHIEEEALPSIDLHTGQPLDTSTEPEAIYLNEHHELELEPLVREAIQLAEPIAPLCEENCPGLCPVCGERMTGGPHDHPDDDIDPRLEVLRAFRVDDDSETR
jgi:uncharacterized protein